MELPKRKRNRLKYYDYSKPGAYFITICTEGRRKILSDIVGDVVAWFKYTVTKTYNEHYGVSGKRIFQRSFHDHVIRNRESLEKIREYILTNPQTWENDCFYISK